MTSKVLCNNCIHYDPPHSCSAYPEALGMEIPEEIFFGSNPHTTVQDDQVGEMTFEPIKDSVITKKEVERGEKR